MRFENVIDGVTYREEADEQTGHREKVVIETKDKTKIPTLLVEGKDVKVYNLPYRVPYLRHPTGPALESPVFLLLL